MHRELLSILPVRYSFELQIWKEERYCREETGPLARSRLFSEGCAPTFADIQLYLPLRDVLGRRVPVSAFWRYRVSLQRKKCCQQIIGLDDESFSVAVCIDAKEKSVLGEMLGDAVRPALCV
jgi:hypothetical protein